MRVLAAIILVGNVLFSNDQVDWTTFDDLPEKMREAPKPILIFITADWCKFCEMQKNTTFKSLEVISKINAAYYAIELDGEGKDPITFLNRIYGYKPTGSETGYHELAYFLGSKDGDLTFPTPLSCLNNSLCNERKLDWWSESSCLKC